MMIGPLPPELPLILPAASPAWISAELVRRTLETWQPYYGRPLTIDEAIDILQNVGRLIDHLGGCEP